MKGTLYSGIAYFPQHPKADLHGHVRCIVRTSSIQALTDILRTYDIAFSPVLFNWGIWAASASIVEQQATEREYGRALVCAIYEQYLSPANYQRIPDHLKRKWVATGAAEDQQRQAGFMTASIGPHLFTPWDGDVGQRRACQHCPKSQADPIHVRETNP